MLIIKFQYTGEDIQYNFFYLMPKEDSNIDKMREKLTGDTLVNILNNAKQDKVDVCYRYFFILF